MFKRLKIPLQKQPAAAAASAAEDPRIAQVRAAHAGLQGRYANIAQAAITPGASLQTLMDFAEACFGLERDGECEDVLRRALALEPDNPLAHYSMALLISGNARFAEAEAHLRAALKQAPTDWNLRLSLAMILLTRQNLAEGHRLFRARMEGPSHQAPQISRLPPWRGEPLAGKTLVLWSDWGGLGDDIAYVRFVRAIRESHRPTRLIVAVPRRLVRLFAAQPYVDQAVDLSEQVAADAQCGLIEAANVLGTSVESLPAWPRYLDVTAADERYWRSRFEAEQRLKVGLVWTSTSVPPVETGWVGRFDKHLPGAALAPLCGMPGVVFVSLQKGAGIPRLAELLPGAAVIDDSDDQTDMADTAALVRQLDLVLSIDTSLGHLGGALGVPTLMLLRKSLSMFWPESSETSPWYPSVRMAVQEEMRDWGPVVARARSTIERMAAGIPWPACFDQLP